MNAPEQITSLLRRLRRGDTTAASSVLPLLYDELRAIAAGMMRGGRSGHTLQPTALVHEAWLKIARAGGESDVNDRQHFLAIAATAMRQVLINHSRDRRTRKRGGGEVPVPLDECVEVLEAETGDLVAFHDLLERFAKAHPRPARIVEMRVFAGMLVEEVAQELDVAPSTVKADWRFARAWLQDAMPGGGD